MSAYSDLILSLSPLAYWRLGTTVGTETDLGSGGHTLTYNGGETRGVVGLIYNDPDLAVSLPGTAGVFPAAAHAADINFTAAPFTVMAWVKATSGATRYVFNQRSASAGYGMGIDLNGKVSIVHSNVAAVTGTNVISFTDRHLIAYSFKAGTSYDIFLDGGLLENIVIAAPLTEATAAAQIGSDTGNAFPFAGTLDEVAIFNTNLTPSQHAALYQLGAGWQPGSPAHLPFMR